MSSPERKNSTHTHTHTNTLTHTHTRTHTHTLRNPINSVDTGAARPQACKFSEHVRGVGGSEGQSACLVEASENSVYIFKERLPPNHSLPVNQGAQHMVYRWGNTPAWLTAWPAVRFTWQIAWLTPCAGWPTCWLKDRLYSGGVSESLCLKCVST